MIKTTRLKTSQVPKNVTYDLTPQVDGVKQTFELPEKVYDLDQHYVLFNGQVYRNDGNHTFYTISADGMELTTLFDEAPRPGVSHVLQFVKTESVEGDDAASKSYVDEKVADEATARGNADIALGRRIDTIVAASDVKDIVGTHADLESYDTSMLGDNDIIKVLADETQGGKISYYRWNATSSQFSLIGSEGPYQMALTAGANITIDANNEISATDTTYSDFVGTDGVDAGTAGLVPAPATTDADKFLKSDGTWAEAGGGTLYTTYGQNTDGAMTQKATTDLVYTAGDPKKINIGDNGVTGGTNSIIIGSEDSGTITAAADQIIIGHNITDSKAHTTVIGHGASVSGTYSVSVGENTSASGEAIAIGHSAYASSDSIAIGTHNVSASGQYSVQIGTGRASGAKSIHISSNNESFQTQVAGEESIGIGTKVNIASTAPRSVAIGNLAEASSTAVAGVAIGNQSKVSDTVGVAIGNGAKCEYTYSVGLGALSKPRVQGVVDVSTGTTIAKGYQGANDQDRTNLRVISGVHDGELATDAATVNQAVGTTETYTIAGADWVALSGATPYTYSADVTATATIGANTICELFNDDAVTFATYGFAIGVVNSQTVTIYSVGAPTSSVTLKINYKG